MKLKSGSRALCLISLTLATIFPELCSSDKILILSPIAVQSHTNVFDPLIRALAARGHHLTVLMPPSFSGTLPPNTTVFSPFSVKDFLSVLPKPFDLRKLSKFESMSNTLWKSIGSTLVSCTKIYENAKFQEFIQDRYDLVIMNAWFNECFVGVISKVRAPFIALVTMPPPSYIMERTGNRLPSSFVPNVFLGQSDRMTFGQRVSNLIMNLLMKYIEYDNSPKFESLYRKYLGSNIPSIAEINRNISLILSNSHFALTYPRPQLPDNIEVGGMHCRPARPLPKDLGKFLSEAPNGFIYFSLGSIVQASKMPEDYRKIFLRVFSRLNQTVIWKWEDENMSDLPPNVKISKWLPQQDILGHPNIRAFITHGGLLSTQEAVYHGVPLIGIPFFADQDLNMLQAESKGYALKMEFLQFNEGKFEGKLHRILNEPKFTERVKELSVLFRDQPQSPVERAVFWTEYILRHKGASQLRSSARDLNAFQYYSLDVIGFLVLVLLLIVLIPILACKSGINWYIKSTHVKVNFVKKIK